MSVGIQPSTADINNMSGGLTRDLNNLFSRIQQFEQWLVQTPDATLEAAPYSMAPADVANLKSAFSDLDQLRTLYQGTAVLASAKDFRTFAKLLWGFGF